MENCDLQQTTEVISKGKIMTIVILKNVVVSNK